MSKGRRAVDIDENALLDMVSRGYSHKEMAETFDVHPLTIGNRIAKLQKEQGLLTHYRSVQSLHLTQMKIKILESITPDKIAQAPLSDLVRAYKIFNDAERVIEGKPTELKGLMAYLIQVEKEEVGLLNPPDGIEVMEKEEDPDINWEPELVLDAEWEEG